MNVAIFASSFYPHLGGVEELCRQLTIEYQRRGFGVSVFTNKWPRDLPEKEVVGGIRVYRLAMRVAASSVKSRISYALTGRSVRQRLLDMLGECQPDVLHVQCVSCNAAYALMAKQEMELPLVVTLQGELTMDASQLFQREAWAKRVMRESLEAAEAITACSLQTLEEAQAWFGKPFGDRGRVIYNGIASGDSRVKPYEHPQPYLLAIGRHVPQKGFDLLLRAMAKLVMNESFQHDLILAGDGMENGRLRALMSELKLEKRVMFTGRVDHTRAMELFAGCSFFVLPSRHEPFGIVNLEAMAAGKAIVAARVGGVSEIVEDGVNGLLVRGDDIEGLIAGIALLAKDDSLRSRLAIEGKRRASRFTWPAIADQYVNVYRQVESTIVGRTG